MNNILLDIVQKDGGYYFSETSEALVYALLGFLIVFAGIVIIIAIIWLLGLIMRKTDNLTFASFKKKKDGKPVNEDDEDTSGEVPDEIKAAVVAALMAFYETSEPKCEFKVKRIKRL